MFYAIELNYQGNVRISTAFDDPLNMTRYKPHAMLLAAMVLGSTMVIPLANAPAAYANCNANQQWDPVNGTCWTKQDRNGMGNAQGANGCRPGELGNCLGALQNATVPGANLPARPSVDGASVGGGVAVTTGR